MRYRHLTMYEREVIECVRRSGGSLREAARSMGRAVSTISREIRRNSKGREYRAVAAHRFAANRLR